MRMQVSVYHDQLASFLDLCGFQKGINRIFKVIHVCASKVEYNGQYQ